MGENPAIVTTNLGMVYRTGFWGRKTRALTNLNLEVAPKEIFGYLGANGAGKTTTIKILVGLMHPTTGSARILGEDWRSIAVKRRIGYMPEDPYFYEYLTAEESLDFYGRLLDVPRAKRRCRIDELLRLMELTDARKKRLRAFSKGMRQRLGLAQALINEPELVILDEPMSGLDPMGRMQMRQTILELREQGRTVFFSSHILADVEMICDRVGMLVKGELVAVGRLETLLASRLKAVEVTGEGVSEEGIALLRGLDQRLRRSGSLVSLRVPDEKAASEAERIILQHGGHLRAMVPQRETLEEYFVRRSGVAEEKNL